MRKKITLAMAMIALAVATQAQDKVRVASTKEVKAANVKGILAQKQTNSMFGMELQQFLGTNKVKTSSKYARSKGINEQQIVNVMVLLLPSAGITAEMLESAGCKVNWAMKSQAFVTVSVDKLDEIAKIDGVLGINLPEKLQLHNNIAREESKVSLVADPLSAQREGLPKAYDGSGVIVGVVDTGIDFGHPAFRNADGTTRIKRAFTYRRTDEIQPDEPESNWKNTYTDPEEILNVEPVTIETHGSHTMGTAAGSNTGNNLQGMAPGADLVPADLIDLYYNYLVSGVKSICDYAQEVGKPVVTNYSIGTPGSFRDGCHPVSQALIELTDNGTKPGVIFSLSAGNEGFYNSHVHHTFTSDDEKIYVMMSVPSDTMHVETEDGLFITHPLNKMENLSGFTNKDVDNEVEMMVAYSLSEKRILDLDEKIGFAGLYADETEDGDITYSILPTSKDSEYIGLHKVSLYALLLLLNKAGFYTQFRHNCYDGVTHKRQITFQTSEDMKINLLEDIRLGGCFSMPAGTELTIANMTNGKGGNLIKPEGFDFVTAGKPNGCINETACNMANITVGSYNVRNEYTTYFGDDIEYDNQIGEVSNFTSYGYTNDGNNLQKPDVLAPGSYLLSAVNGNYNEYFETYGNPMPKEKMKYQDCLAQKIEYDGKNYWYEYMQGTSMAAPTVTGIIALWLQADPTLSVRDVRDVIAHSSVPYEGKDPVQSSLFGKIDALAGLKYIVNEITGIDNITYPQNFDSTDNRIFTLDGREVKGAPARGFYIKGGKKIVKTIDN